MTSNYYKFIPLFLTIISIGVIVCSLNLYSSIRDISEDAITSSDTFDALTSEGFRHSLYVAIGVLIPLTVDHLLTLYTLWAPDLLGRVESYVLPSLIFIIQPCNIYFVSSEITTSYFWLYHAMMYFEIFAICNSMFAMQIYSVQKETNPTMLRSILTTMAIFNVALLLKFTYSLYDQLAVGIVWMVLLLFELIGSGFIMYNWFQRHQTALKTGLQDRSNIYSFWEMCIMTCFILAIELFDVGMEEHGIFEASSSKVVFYNTLIISSFYLLSETHVLKNKQLARFSMEALETKRSFVRYVSHEIRTPLNAATMGLTLLNKEVLKLLSKQNAPPASVSSACHKLLELVADTNQACSVAVEILSELLLYEKIDGGLLALEAQEVFLWPYVEEVLKLFTVQAKALELELIWQPLLDTKLYVTIDRYKMSQVIRNLVSNALKFSKPGQKVIVSAEIIPAFSTRLRAEANGGLGSVPSSPYRVNNSNRVLPATVSEHDGEHLHIQRHHSHGSMSNATSHQMTGSQESHSPIHLQINTNRSPTRRSSFERLQGWLQDWFRPGNTTEDSVSVSAGATLFNSLAAVSNSAPFMSENTTDMIRLSFMDFGPGISKENQKRLFLEIVQFDAAKLQQGKGSGIGLWISNKIMKLHGGRIGVESEGEGMGSNFYIDIPIARYTVTAANRPQRSTVALRELLRSMIANDVESLAPAPGNNNNNNGNNGNGNGNNENSLHLSSSTRLPLSLDSNFGAIPMLPFHSQDADDPIPSGRVYPDSSVPQLMRQSSRTSQSTAGPIRPTRKLLIVDDSLVNRKMLRKYFMNYFDICDEACNGLEAIKRIQQNLQSFAAPGSTPAAQSLPSNLPVTAFGYDCIILDYFMPEMNGLEVLQRLKIMQYPGKIFGLTGNTEESMRTSFLDAGAYMVLIKPLQPEDLQKIVDETEWR